MNPLLVALMAVDEAHGGRQMRQLSHGWMGWESKSGRRLRSLGARTLLALAGWLAPERLQEATIDSAILESAR